MAQIVRCQERINHTATKANTKAASAAEPTVLLGSNQRTPLDITAPAVDYVTRSRAVTAEPLSILKGDARNPVRHNPIVPNVLGHD